MDASKIQKMVRISSFSGKVNPPKGSPEPRDWPMFFIFREKNNVFLDPFRQPIHWRIKHPNDIDREK